jgi:hypothetical protein
LIQEGRPIADDFLRRLRELSFAGLKVRTSRAVGGCVREREPETPSPPLPLLIGDRERAVPAN